jgi:hypothetical protein
MIEKKNKIMNYDLTYNPLSKATIDIQISIMPDKSIGVETSVEIDNRYKQELAFGLATIIAKNEDLESLISDAQIIIKKKFKI